MAQTTVLFEDEGFIGESLTDREKALLFNQVYGVLGFGNNLLAALYKDNEVKIQGAAEIAKATLKAPFAGLSAGDSEFGVQPIRAWHVLRTTATTETPNTSWSLSFTGGASTNWIGYSTSRGTAINIDKRLVLLPMGIAFTQGTQPVVEEILFQVNATTYPVMSIRHAWLTDYNGVRFCRIRPMIWRSKGTVLGQTWAIATQTNEMVVIGLAFGMGDLLRTQSPSAVQT